MKVACSKCGRESSSAATHPQRLCIGCAYLGAPTVKKILARAGAQAIERPAEKKHKTARRRESFRKGASA